jgi:hypothetical protein
MFAPATTLQPRTLLRAQNPRKPAFGAVSSNRDHVSDAGWIDSRFIVVKRRVLGSLVDVRFGRRADIRLSTRVEFRADDNRLPRACALATPPLAFEALTSSRKMRLSAPLRGHSGMRDCWKSAKWVTRIIFHTEDQRGF